MKKVIVIGCPGAGKSCFARLLRSKSGLPLYYLDQIWHKPDRSHVNTSEFDKKLNDIMLQNEWIIDGNYLRTLERRIAACDSVFFLDYPHEVCLDGMLSRIGKKRDDMPWIETELDPEFKKWIIDFPKDQLPVIYELLEKYKHEKDIQIFKTREEADDYMSRIGNE